MCVCVNQGESKENQICGCVSLSMVVLSIGMGPMPAIVDLWGYDVQNSSFFDRSRPIYNLKTKQYQNFVGVLVGIRNHKRLVIVICL